MHTGTAGPFFLQPGVKPLQHFLGLLAEIVVAIEATGRPFNPEQLLILATQAVTANHFDFVALGG
jgi:hypothetical protein